MHGDADLGYVATAMAEQRLATFVHVSDTHFGELNQDGSSTLDANAKYYWRLHKCFDGYLGHHGLALVKLIDAFQHLEATERARLVTSAAARA